MELYTVNDIMKETDIPESTIRRYCRRFGTFIVGEKFNNAIKYPHEAIERLQYIYSLYQSGKNTDEIRKDLKLKYKEIIEVDLDSENQTDLAIYSNTMPEELLSLIEQNNKSVLEAFNKALEQNNILMGKVMDQDKKIEQLQEEIKKLQEDKQSDMPSEAKKRGIFRLFNRG